MSYPFSTAQAYFSLQIKRKDIFVPQADQRSVYSYLLRLARQGLLERRSAGRGSLAYRLSDRGRKRLLYLQQTRWEPPSADGRAFSE